MKKRSGGAMWLCAILAGVFSTAYAEEKEKEGLQLKVGGRATYNDNIFLSKSNEKKDFLFSILPEAKLDLVTRVADITLSYSPEFVLPMIHFGDDHVRKILHRGGLKSVSEFSNGMVFTLNDELLMLPQTFGTPDNGASRLVQSNYVTAELKQQLELGGRTALNLAGGAGRFDASQKGAARTDFSGSVEINYELHPRVTLGLIGDVTRQIFDSTLGSDLWRYGYRVSPTFLIAPRLTLNAQLGQQWIQFDRGGDAHDLRIDSRLSYEVVESQPVNVTFQRAYLTSASGDPFRVQTIGVEGKWPFSERLKVGGGISYGWFRQLVPDPISGALQQQTDTLLSFRPGVWYNTSEHLTAETGYSFNFNRGQYSANDFNNNIFYIGVTYAFLGDG